MPRCCCVPNCGKRQTSYQFPKDDTMRFKWTISIKDHSISKERWTIRSPLSRVCIDHFLSTDFAQPIVEGEEVLLHKAVPTVFPGRTLKPDMLRNSSDIFITNSLLDNQSYCALSSSSLESPNYNISSIMNSSTSTHGNNLKKPRKKKARVSEQVEKPLGKLHVDEDSLDFVVVKEEPLDDISASTDNTDPLATTNFITVKQEPIDREVTMARIKQQNSDVKTKSNDRMSYRRLSISNKIQILNKLEAGLTIRHVAKIFQLPSSTVSHIKQLRKKIKECASCVSPDVAKRLVRPRHPVLHITETVLCTWITKQREKGVVLNDILIRNKAKSLFKCLKIKNKFIGNFSASHGWFQRYKKIYLLRNIELSEESEKATEYASTEMNATSECVPPFRCTMDKVGDVVNTAYKEQNIEFGNEDYIEKVNIHENCEFEKVVLDDMAAKEKADTKESRGKLQKLTVFLDAAETLKQSMYEVEKNEHNRDVFCSALGGMDKVCDVVNTAYKEQNIEFGKEDNIEKVNVQENCDFEKLLVLDDMAAKENADTEESCSNLQKLTVFLDVAETLKQGMYEVEKNEHNRDVFCSALDGLMSSYKRKHQDMN